MLGHWYSSQHWDGCMCDSCERVFRNANPSYPNVISCGCRGCQNRHREQLNSAARNDIALTMGMETPGMATVNICERNGCETFVKGKALGGITLVLSNDSQREPSTNVIRLELCPGCVKDVYDIITIAPLSDRARSYSEPFNPQQNEGAGSVAGMTNTQLAAALLERLLGDPEIRKQLPSTE